MSSSVSSLSSTLAFQLAEAEPGGGQVEQARRVDVADHLERVLGPVGELVDVDEERVQLARRRDVAAAAQEREPGRLLRAVA